MKFNKDFWFTNWPRVGIIVAVFSLILLFFNTHVSIGSVQWFFWLCIPLYMIHQFEEYVWPGGFEKEINQIFSKGGSTETLTTKDAFFVNIILIWILTPILIILNYVSIVFPIIMVTIVGVNGLTHVVAAIRMRKYNPGLIMSILFNLPLSIYVLTTIAVNEMSTWLGLLIGIVIGIILHGGLFIFLLVKSRKIQKSN
jgi:hypothetical protein